MQYLRRVEFYTSSCDSLDVDHSRVTARSTLNAVWVRLTAAASLSLRARASCSGKKPRANDWKIHRKKSSLVFFLNFVRAIHFFKCPQMQSVSLSVRHTRDPRLNGSRYQNTARVGRDSDVSSFLCQILWILVISQWMWQIEVRLTLYQKRDLTNNLQ